jgi:hypothetical protein
MFESLSESRHPVGCSLSVWMMVPSRYRNLALGAVGFRPVNQTLDERFHTLIV